MYIVPNYRNLNQNKVQIILPNKNAYYRLKYSKPFHYTQHGFHSLRDDPLIDTHERYYSRYHNTNGTSLIYENRNKINGGVSCDDYFLTDDIIRPCLISDYEDLIPIDNMILWFPIQSKIFGHQFLFQISLVEYKISLQNVTKDILKTLNFCYLTTIYKYFSENLHQLKFVNNYICVINSNSAIISKQPNILNRKNIADNKNITIYQSTKMKYIKFENERTTNIHTSNFSRDSTIIDVKDIFDSEPFEYDFRNSKYKYDFLKDPVIAKSKLVSTKEILLQSNQKVIEFIDIIKNKFNVLNKYNYEPSNISNKIYYSSQNTIGFKKCKSMKHVKKAIANLVRVRERKYLGKSDYKVYQFEISEASSITLSKSSIASRFDWEKDNDINKHKVHFQPAIHEIPNREFISETQSKMELISTNINNSVAIDVISHKLFSNNSFLKVNQIKSIINLTAFKLMLNKEMGYIQTAQIIQYSQNNYGDLGDEDEKEDVEEEEYEEDEDYEDDDGYDYVEGGDDFGDLDSNIKTKNITDINVRSISSYADSDEMKVGRESIKPNFRSRMRSTVADLFEMPQEESTEEENESESESDPTPSTLLEMSDIITGDFIISGIASEVEKSSISFPSPNTSQEVYQEFELEIEPFEKIQSNETLENYSHLANNVNDMSLGVIESSQSKEPDLSNLSSEPDEEFFQEVESVIDEIIDEAFQLLEEEMMNKQTADTTSVESESIQIALNEQQPLQMSAQTETKKDIMEEIGLLMNQAPVKNKDRTYATSDDESNISEEEAIELNKSQPKILIAETELAVKEEVPNPGELLNQVNSSDSNVELNQVVEQDVVEESEKDSNYTMEKEDSEIQAELIPNENFHSDSEEKSSNSMEITVLDQIFDIIISGMMEDIIGELIESEKENKFIVNIQAAEKDTYKSNRDEVIAGASEYETANECSGVDKTNYKKAKLALKKPNLSATPTWLSKFKGSVPAISNLFSFKSKNGGHDKLTEGNVLLAAFCALYNPLQCDYKPISDVGFNDFFSHVTPTIKANFKTKTPEYFQSISSIGGPICKRHNNETSSYLTTTSKSKYYSFKEQNHNLVTNYEIYEFLKNLVIILKIEASSNVNLNIKIKHGREVIARLIKFYNESSKNSTFFFENQKDVIGYVKLVEKNFCNCHITYNTKSQTNLITYSDMFSDNIDNSKYDDETLVDIEDLNLKLRNLMSEKVSVHDFIADILNMLQVKQKSLIQLKNKMISSYDSIEVPTSKRLLNTQNFKTKHRHFPKLPKVDSIIVQDNIPIDNCGNVDATPHGLIKERNFNSRSTEVQVNNGKLFRQVSMLNYETNKLLIDNILKMNMKKRCEKNNVKHNKNNAYKYDKKLQTVKEDKYVNRNIFKNTNNNDKSIPNPKKQLKERDTLFGIPSFFAYDDDMTEQEEQCTCMCCGSLFKCKDDEPKRKIIT